MSFGHIPMMHAGDSGAAGKSHREKLREYVKQRGITISDAKGRTIEVEELLDEAFGPEPKTPGFVPLVIACGLGVFVLLIVFFLAFAAYCHERAAAFV